MSFYRPVAARAWRESNFSMSGFWSSSRALRSTSTVFGLRNFATT
jgi:hypothetical protein